jgi:hypothetical protein
LGTFSLHIRSTIIGPVETVVKGHQVKMRGRLDEREARGRVKKKKKKKRLIPSNDRRFGV